MTRTARPSLANAFAPNASVPAAHRAPDRVAGLIGLLPPRPAPDPAQDLAPATSTLDSAGTTADAEPAPNPALDPPVPVRAADGDPSRIRNVAFYLPPDLLERLRRTAQSRQLTYADLLVEAAGAHLDAVAADLAAAQPVTPAGGMPGRARRRTGPSGIQRQIRLDGHQLAWLDEHVTRLHAPSRNALVVALLTAHLNGASS